ncbi:predicted protein [Arabidopsis lyrata subsp. lyrata]|uniref:Predicted protein n=1 Tax=Arabidopsis lyrata subsp. lyrata TaxID=81972 RepID=D7MVQ4_ARALL|nr:predicted protein [Arabidopsis lyrata subsp. lyrata]
MDSSCFFLTIIAAAIGFFLLFRKLRFHQEDNKEKNSSSSSSSTPSSLAPSSPPPSSLDPIWTHHVFPSFRGEDVRRDFLSHIQMEFQRMGITPFIDNEIERGQSIGPELIRAIRESKIAIILLSRNYASSSWCLDELAEIMKCREELGQTVLAVFYKVDPSDVNKLTGDFGKVFKKTCAGKTKEHVGRWRQALANVATIAGYHSTNWDNEATMIRNIATDISNKLNNSASSSDFDGLVGMTAHLKKMEPLLCLGSDEVRMIGIWGPSGIGKTTIARVVYNKLSNSFQLSVFMESIEAKYTRPCSDDYSAKLQLQQQFMSQITNQSDMKISHLGSYFRGMSKLEWTKALPRLRSSLDADILSILKFSYDALDDEDKYLFLHIACFFNREWIVKVEEYLAETFLDVSHRLNGLAEKSLISLNGGYINMHDLLVKLGIDIVRKQSLREPGQRLFLVDAREICEVLNLDANGSRSVMGINFNFGEDRIKEKLHISERAFQGMSNLQFLRVKGNNNTIHLPHGLEYISRKLRLLQWTYFPMTCLPPIFNTEFLVELVMPYSKLEKLWEGIKLPSSIGNATNLELLDLGGCSSLVELPSSIGNLINLKELHLSSLSSLVELPSSIGNLINLKELDLSSLSCLVELPFWIGNATNLEVLNLDQCSSLVKLPFSIGNLQKLQTLTLRGCSKLEDLPANIKLGSLGELDLTDCLLLKRFPLSIKSWSRLNEVDMSYTENLKNFPHAFDIITGLHMTNTEIQEVPPWVKKFSRLTVLILKGCKKLVSLPQIPDSISYIDAQDCESLERVDCSFHNPKIWLIFSKCFKLNQEARDLIIQTPTSRSAVLPGREVPAYFTHQSTTGGSLTIKLNEKPLPTSMRFKACILLVHKGDNEARDDKNWMDENCYIVSCKKSKHYLYPVLAEHVYVFEVEADVTSSGLVFEFKIRSKNWKIKECGVFQLSEVP